MRRDGEKVIAGADCVAQFGDQLIAGIRAGLVLLDSRFFSAAFESDEAWSEVSLGFLTPPTERNSRKFSGFLSRGLRLSVNKRR
jgi:hypothetical protein